MESVKELFAILIEVEECPADFNNYRQRAQLLRRLKFTSFEKIFSDTTNNIKELGNGTNIAMVLLFYFFIKIENFLVGIRLAFSAVLRTFYPLLAFTC